jgi:alpha-glucosidase
VHVHVKAEEIPFFVRAGAVLPVYPVRQWTGEKPIHELSLYVYYKEGTERSHLYEDEGEGYEYRNQHYSLKIFETEGKAGVFTLRWQHDVKGAYIPPYKRIKVFLIGFPAFVRHCQADQKEVPVKEIRLRERSLYTLELPSEFKEIIWRG